MSSSSHFAGTMEPPSSTKHATPESSTSRAVDPAAASAGQDALSPAARLCLSCALCCDATLFERTPLSPHEASGGVHHWPQPCPHLTGTRCGVYAQRPQVCRAYRCLLLEALDAHELDLDAALAVAARFRREGRGRPEDLAFHFGRRGVR